MQVGNLHYERFECTIAFSTREKEKLVIAILKHKLQYFS